MEIPPPDRRPILLTVGWLKLNRMRSDAVAFETVAVANDVDTPLLVDMLRCSCAYQRSQMFIDICLVGSIFVFVFFHICLFDDLDGRIRARLNCPHNAVLECITVEAQLATGLDFPPAAANACDAKANTARESHRAFPTFCEILLGPKETTYLHLAANPVLQHQHSRLNHQPASEKSIASWSIQINSIGAGLEAHSNLKLAFT